MIAASVIKKGAKGSQHYFKKCCKDRLSTISWNTVDIQWIDFCNFWCSS